MRIGSLIFVVVFLLISCRKDVDYCVNKYLAGKYYSRELNDSIFISDVNYLGNKLYTELPQIIKDNGSPYNFSTRVDLVRDGCQFNLESFYDNYAESSYGSQYSMIGQGTGHFEANKVIFDYRVKVTMTWGSPSNETVVFDSTFSSTYFKM